MFHLANLELEKYGRPIRDLAPEEVADFFIARAPRQRTVPPWGPAPTSDKVKFVRRSIDGGRAILERPGAANVRLLEIFEDVPGPELVVADMLSGWVTWMDPDDPQGTLKPIVRLKNPCHIEAVDLNQDGQMDLLVADLGDPEPSDVQLGTVVLLKRTGSREFEVVPLTGKMGRVADARAADFDSDGDLDIIIGEFGWRKLGSLVYLENVSDANQLIFEPRTLDPRHGAIHVPIVDLNSDGKPDFLALLSQEHEVVEAFINLGNGEFTIKEVYSAPHPQWGSSGMELIDFDGDGDQDVLATNGDTLDDMRLKAYHGIFWLENEGQFPFRYHRIDDYYGVHRAEAGDLDGDGDLDIVASSFLPGLSDEARERLQIEGLVWYEQTETGAFEKRVFGEVACDFPTLELGDINGDGLLDVITGNLFGFLNPDGSDPALVEIFQQVK
jgi:hypothetical protein